MAKERSESAFRNLVEAAESTIVLVRPDDLAILSFSPLAEQISGYSAAEVLGKSFVEALVPEAERPQLVECCRQASAGSFQRQIEGTIVCRDGSTRIMLRNIRCLPDYDGSPALLIVGHDITELKRAQERALDSERMAAIGQMCAGLAHESRNALQRSQACLEMLAIRLSGRPELKNLIDRIQQCRTTCTACTRTCASSPPRSGCRSPTAILSRSAAGVVTFEGQHAGKPVTLLDSLGELSLSCQADAFRLEQVFRNVLDNVLAACAGQPEIVIQIAASPAVIDGRSRSASPFATMDQDWPANRRPRSSSRSTPRRSTAPVWGWRSSSELSRPTAAAPKSAAGSRGAEILLTLPRTQGR